MMMRVQLLHCPSLILHCLSIPENRSKLLVPPMIISMLMTLFLFWKMKLVSSLILLGHTLAEKSELKRL